MKKNIQEKFLKQVMQLENEGDYFYLHQDYIGNKAVFVTQLHRIGKKCFKRLNVSHKHGRVTLIGFDWDVTIIRKFKKGGIRSCLNKELYADVFMDSFANGHIKTIFRDDQPTAQEVVFY